MAKTCPACSVNKPYSEFYQRKRADSFPGDAGYQTVCKECFKAQRKEYVAANQDKRRQTDRQAYNKNKDRWRNANYTRNFGITLTQYNELFMAQNGCCDACGRHQTELSKRLAVDHNHETLEIRGLLCQSCNRCLGYAADSIERLNNLITYLNKTPVLAGKSSNVVCLATAKKAG